MKYKNYYKILGLSSAKATDDEIKSAYRHMAKLYHPDLNNGDMSVAEKFKDVNEAYQILGNDVARKKYDRVYFAYKFRDGFSTATVKNKFNVTTGLNDFFTTFFGDQSNKTVITNFDKYYQTNHAVIGDDLESEIDISLEEAFFGGEKKISFKTVDNKMKTILLKIPKGIHSGEKIRLSGQGKPGKNGGESGDLYIKINILPHEIFKIEGNNIIKELLITPWEAALGCETNVVGIDSQILLNIPEGTQTGDQFRIPNGGYFDGQGSRGELLIIVKIMIPNKLTDKEKELFLKFKEISTFNPRS